MQQVSKSAKDLITKILLPEAKRYGSNDIFNHPWMLKEGNKVPLKINFNKLVAFSKFSKVISCLLR